jgi:hypothetical protein
MGPVLYSDVVYQGPELGAVPTSKIPGALTLWRRQNIIYGDVGMSIAGLVADRGILLVCAGLDLLREIQDLVPETLTIARLTEDEIHVQLELTNTLSNSPINCQMGGYVIEPRLDTGILQCHTVPIVSAPANMYRLTSGGGCEKYPRIVD